jgi:hypothetical protein
MAQMSSPVAPISMPYALGDCCGIKAKVVTTSTDKSASSASAARVGKWENCRMRARLIETATNRSPVSAAAAPSSPTRKLF